MNDVLTATDLKSARESLNLSQAKVAREAKINRSYLSQFEGGQRLFSDEQMQTLFTYYKSQGMKESVITESTVEEKVTAGLIELRDGFQIPTERWYGHIDDNLEQYYSNEVELESLLPVTEKEGGFLSGDDQEFHEACNKALRLMAANYLHIKCIQGVEDTLEPLVNEDDIRTCRHYLKETLPLGDE